MGCEKKVVCWDCRAGFQFIGKPYCQKCGDPVDGSVEDAFTCAWCCAHDVSFNLARSATRYRGGLRAALHAFKYERDMSLVADLGELLLACVRVHYTDVLFDAVTYVPLHPSKERARSFNQARSLSTRLGRRLGGLPVRRTLARVRNTGSQTHLTARQRRQNVRGAFCVRDSEWVRGRTFLLVDDVMTTGATVEECSRVLMTAGAAGVYVATVARG